MSASQVMNLEMLDALQKISIPLVLSGLTVVVALQFFRKSGPSGKSEIRAKGYQLPLPPGPKPLPLLGNMLDLPRKYEWETFTKWAHEYGKTGSPFSGLWRVDNDSVLQAISSECALWVEIS